MNYGCIGEHLGHSFSKEIHALVADYDYALCELAPDEVESFMKAADFRAINVTIPYKEKVIPYLSYVDEGAELIGSVNTVVKRDGVLCGYNTDFYGMTKLAEHAGISFTGRKVLILGTGGTSRTAYAVATAHGAREVIKVSRNPKNGAISYTNVYKHHTNAEIIINTTPVGMYPDIFGCPIDLSPFNSLCGVLDAVYNPLSTPLILEAKRRGIPAEGGLYMLVAQGIRASEIFLDKNHEDTLLDSIYSKIRADKENIVLIGMPSSGKTTVGRIIAERLGRELIDSDEVIAAECGKTIAEIFSDIGEEGFRELEARCIARISARSSAVIATGGGAILREENRTALSENGRIYFIDRPLDMLIPTCDRPTASTSEAIAKRYAERYAIYRTAADVTVDGADSAESVADAILNDFFA